MFERSLESRLEKKSKLFWVSINLEFLFVSVSAVDLKKAFFSEIWHFQSFQLRHFNFQSNCCFWVKILIKFRKKINEVSTLWYKDSSVEYPYKSLYRSQVSDIGILGLLSLYPSPIFIFYNLKKLYKFEV